MLESIRTDTQDLGACNAAVIGILVLVVSVDHVPVVLYLAIGLIRPPWGLATKQSTIVIVSVVIALIASTAFYIAIQPLDAAPDGQTATGLSNNEPEPTPQP